MNGTPKVSVCIPCYRQADLVDECLRSVLTQVTTFPFEVIVRDDASPDDTANVLRRWAEAYPDKLRVIINETNLGAIGNYLASHDLARGDYVAHMDGDDLALPGKLQAQADLLDRRPDVAISAHAVEVIAHARTMGTEAMYPELGGIEHLVRHGTYFVHSSVMYRRSARVGFDRIPLDEVIDFRSHIEMAAHGKVHLSRQILGGYRWHAAGISKNPVFRNFIENAYDKAFARARALGVSDDVVKAGILRHRMNLAIARLTAGEYHEFKRLIVIPSGWFRIARPKHVLLHVFRSLCALKFIQRAIYRKVSA